MLFKILILGLTATVAMGASLTKVTYPNNATSKVDMYVLATSQPHLPYTTTSPLTHGRQVRLRPRQSRSQPSPRCCNPLLPVHGTDLLPKLQDTLEARLGQEGVHYRVAVVASLRYLLGRVEQEVPQPRRRGGHTGYFQHDSVRYR